MKWMMLFLLLFGCESARVDQVLDEDIVYRRDIIIAVNGRVGEGVLVLPQAPKYDFTIEARGDLDLFVLTSCNREWTKEKAWNVSEVAKIGWFGWGERKITKKRQVSFTYIPDTLEKNEACPLWLGGFDQNGKHSWGFVDFEGTVDTLPARVHCNGETTRDNGVSVCQSKEGLIQGVEFETEVIATTEPPTCELDNTRGIYFEFGLARGECTYLFKTIAKPRKSFRLTTIGYQKIRIREL